MKDVESSMLKAVGYDAGSQTLTVKFTSSDEVYTYQGVPKDVYDSIMSSDSMGTYFTENVKGKFEYTKSGGE
ncbi:MAG: KTSC domain-containing protein [Verrucomicrobia bacterium]|nr:KTSC domain-containing protein [Verrucomicrobiota bacterium]